MHYRPISFQKYRNAEKLPETAVHCPKQNIKNPPKSTLSKKNYDQFKSFF